MARSDLLMDREEGRDVVGIRDTAEGGNEKWRELELEHREVS